MTKSYLKNLEERLTHVISERPVILLSVMGIASVILTFYRMFLFTALILIALFVAGFLCNKTRRGIYFITIIFCLFLSMSVYLRSQNNKELPHSDSIRIVSCNYKLDGSCLYYGQDNLGNIVVLNGINDYLGVGAVINGDFNYEIPDSPRNPGQFDYKEYLNKKGVYYTIKVQNFSSESNSIFNILNSFKILLHELRTYLFNLMTTNLDDDNRGVVAAVLFGDSSFLTNDIREFFSRASLSHLLVVSGAHFSSFMICLPFILEIFNLSKSKRNFITVTFILFIGFFMNWTTSVTRAAFMSVSLLFGRERLSSMALTAVIMMLCNPFTVLGSGFQMSFLTTLFICLFGRKMGDLLERFGLSENISSVISCNMSAKLAMLVFGSSVSSEISLLSVATNILCSFIVELICIMFIPSIVLLLININFIKDMIVVLIVILNKVAAFSSHLSYYSYKINENNFAYVILIFLGIFFIFCKRYIICKILRPVSCIFLSFVLCLSILSFLFPDDETIVVFADVSQGDSCLIISKGKSLLIDGGIYEMGEQVLIPLLDYYDINKPDYTIMSHWDSDHSGGIECLKDKGRCGIIYTSVLKDENSGYSLVRAGDSFVVGSCIIDCLWPFEATVGDNPDSLVLLISVNNTKFLFTGDIGSEEEERIIRKYNLQDVNILKVSHHGSRFSSSEFFLSEVTPDCSIISVGRYNNYGHPSDEAVDRLTNSGTTIYLTSNSGAIIVNVRKKGYAIEGFIDGYGVK